jgi:hypothetical protein
MIKEICVIIPTRKRLFDFNFCAATWKKTTEGKSAVVVGIDEDDYTYDDVIKKNSYPFIWERNQPGPFLPMLNKLALKYAKEYKYVAYIADDLTFNTFGWETIIINKLDELGKNAIGWVNDGHSPVRLNDNPPHNCGIPFMNSSVINRLGYMCSLQLKAGAADNYWVELVKRMPETSYFFKDVIIEHRHFSYGLRFKDETTHKIQMESVPDWQYFSTNQFFLDVEKDVKTLKA